MAKMVDAVHQKIEYLTQKDIWKKVSVWLSIFAAVCMVFPLFFYSSYNFMCMDDYTIGAQTHLAWENRDGFFSGICAVFASVAQKVGTIYMEWGG